MPSGNTLALAADNAQLIQTVKRRLEESLGQELFACDLDGLRRHLDQLCQGMMVVAISSAAGAAAVRSLIQELSIQHCPTIVLLLQGSALAGSADLAALDPYVTARLAWPDEADELVQRLRGNTRRGVTAPRPLSDDEDLRTSLVRYTPSLLPLADHITLASQHDMPILISGETGTGKTFLARLIHDHSERRRHRFLAVPCGAIAANLVESEFFGHIKGAFTGADRDKVGKFEAVGEGTLLLDEIDTLGMEQQAALLRVIETGEFEPVGSIETRTCRSRVIFASNVSLEGAVQCGRFRADLYFRLNVMSFHLPPLRERVQDIAPLARGMVARFNRKFRKDLFDISPEAMAALEGFSWPGNIRQLENVVQHAVLVSRGPELLLGHLPPALQEFSTGSVMPRCLGESLSHQIDLTERTAIQRALQNHNNSRCRAAAALGISRVTLYKKMKKYGLMEPSFPLRARSVGARAAGL
ncbi:MAG: sigma-54 dependent transcriptional regulator [Gemmataceae bacterium]|nr:sigma-54 dependent transcriptional regulator [Gemmataceae bacterium]